MCSGGKLAALKKVAEKNFRPGDVVPETGIYVILHQHNHDSRQELMLLSNAKFPRCRRCGDQVRFQLLRAVPYLFDDEDFLHER